MNRNVPSSSARYLRASISPSSCPCAWGRGRTDATLSAAFAARIEQSVPPRPAQDLDELEPVDGLARSGPTATAPWRSRSTAPANGSGGSVRAAAIRSASSLAAHLAERHERQARQEQRRLGQGRRIGDLAGERQAIAAGRWAWATAPMSGRARGPRGGSPGPTSARGPTARSRVAVRGARADTTTRSSAVELVLAPAGRRDEQPVRVEPDGQVALAGGDQPARAEPSARARMASVAALVRASMRGHPTAPAPSRRRPVRATRRAAARPVPSLGARRPAPDRFAGTATSRSCSVQGVSALGDAVSFTALPLLVLALTGSGLAMGVVGRSRPCRTSSSGWSRAPSPTGATASG